MTIEDLVGNYSIVGRNQDAEINTYKGTLCLTLDHNNRIKAKWIIDNTQEQFGSGFFKNNTLVINFKYYNENNNIYKGVVVYKCISKDILEGFWSEKQGNPLYIGEENCFRIEDLKTVFN